MTTALDLFRGAGGWSVAAKRLGIHDWGVEIMPQANETASAAGHGTLGNDVWEIGQYYAWAIAEGRIASPPCQTFSAAGKGAGRQALDAVLSLVHRVPSMELAELREVGTALLGDERTALVLTPLWYTLNGQAEWAAWEQVPTVLPVWEACAEVLREHGFHAWTGNLQAEQYGVPQTRKRAILIASRKHEVGMPEPTHSKYYSRTPEKLDEGVKPWVSMAEALGWGLSERPSPTITGGGTETGGAEPIAKLGRYTSRSDWAYRNNPMPNQAVRTLDQPAPTLSFGHQYPEWCFRRPSTTIVGSFKPEVVAAPGYRTTVSRQNAPDSVRVTVQEAGVLQSFPADYPWQGAKTKQYLQVGNAIPPLLAEAILREAM